MPRLRSTEKPIEGPKEICFGDPDWIDANVVPLGERGALLWRHLKKLWGEDQVNLQKDWGRHSKGLPRVE